MSNYGYLVHHGVKGQKWGIRRYQNEDGSLTELGRKRYGVDSFASTYNPNKKSERAKIKAYKKDLRSIKRAISSGENVTAEEMALNNEQIDLNNANNDKEFISDLRKETEKFWKAAKTGDQDWMDVEEQSIKRLQKKYPKHKDIISGYAPHEKIYNDSDIKDIFNAKDKNVVGRLLNYDFYYDPYDKKYTDVASKIGESARSEFNKKLYDVYGKDFIDKISSQKPKSTGTGKKVATGVLSVVGPLTVATVIGGGYLLAKDKGKNAEPSMEELSKRIKESLN